MAIQPDVPGDKPSVHARHIQAIISTPLEEDIVPFFLTSISSFIDENTIPSIKHIQVLIHLSLLPPVKATRSPLSLLYRILSLHSPTALGPSLPIPGDVRNGWEALAKVERETKRHMGICEQEGIWGLLWEEGGYRPVSGQEDETDSREEEEEEGRRERVVSERGWEVLGWLEKLWEKDRDEEQKKGQDYSTLFLEQLPQQSKDLTRDDSTGPLAIVKSAFTETPSPESNFRRTLAIGTLNHLFTVASTPKPLFHPPSLILCLITFFQTLTLPQLTSFLTRLDGTTYVCILSHALSIYLETLGGTRDEQSALRRNRRTGKRKKSISGGEAVSNLNEALNSHFPPPTVRYWVRDLLLLKAERSEGEGYMGLVKLKLFGLMLRLYPREGDAWVELSQVTYGWEDSVRQSFRGEGKSYCAGVEIMLKLVRTN